MTHEIFETIRREHGNQRKVSQALKEAKDPEQRRNLFLSLRHALLPHMSAEEATMFRWLTEKAKGEARDDAFESLEEHHVERILVDEIMELDPDSDRFKAKCKVLIEINEHHMEEEEDENFEALAEFSDAELDEMMGIFHQTKERERKVYERELVEADA